MNYSDKIIALIKDANIGTNCETVTENTTLVDLGWDSLDLVEFVMEAEEEFDVDIPDGDAEKAKTIKDFADIIEKQKGLV
jgi:acyl carrier protein